ncbi:MAG: ribosome maturation factor RimM [bacterium]
MEELILIARIKKAHGIKGEVLAEMHTFDPTRFSRLKSVTIKFEKGEDRTLTLSSARVVHQGILLKFEEIIDRNESEKLRGGSILIPISERLELPEGKLYHDEIIGMNVVDHESDTLLGTVADVREVPASLLYIFRLVDGSEKLVTGGGKEIIKVDKQKREVRVSLLADY